VLDVQTEFNVRDWQFAGPVERAYERSTAPVTMIVGPTGGGKTTGSARRCLRVATWQHASPVDGVRRARILCLCPTYRRAWDTVMPSYFKEYPKTMGEFRGSRGDPADHIFDTQMMIGGVASQVHVEVLFRAVNDLDVEEFFRGFEITGLWAPEADTNEDLPAVLSLGANRCGRYPEPDHRPDPDTVDGPAWSGIWGDANAPIIGTHFHNRFYLKRMVNGDPAPASDRLLRQPSGFSANAENLQNLRKIRPDYYADMAKKLEKYDVGRLIGNKPGFGRHGQPVHPNFDEDTHMATRSLDVDPHLPVWIGVDAGSGAMTPAATFSQRTYAGQWRTIAEVFLGKDQMNTEQFGEAIRQVMNSRFRAAKGAMLCIDPAAAAQTPGSQFTTAMALQHETGIEAQLAPTNAPKHRRSAIDKLFLKFVGAREPAKLIDPSCVGLLQGYAGGFHYRKSSQTTLQVSPHKNEFSHVCEADEYAALTIEGLDPTEGPFIRPDGEGGHDAPRPIYD
jgi:hypothetical protein